MFENIILSFPLYAVNSILSGLYAMKLLQAKMRNKNTLILWFLLYFGIEIILFEVIDIKSGIIGITLNALCSLPKSYLWEVEAVYRDLM